MNRIIARARMMTAMLALLLISLVPAYSASSVSANDTARYLAGLMPSAGSPLARLTREGGWVLHSLGLNQAGKRS